MLTISEKDFQDFANVLTDAGFKISLFDEPEEEKKEEYLSRLGFEIEDRMVIYNDKSIALLNKLLTDKYPSIDIYSINLTTSALNGVPVIQDVVVFLRDLDNLTETASPIN